MTPAEPLPAPDTAEEGKAGAAAVAADYARLFRMLPLPHMILDRQLRYVDANDAYCRLLDRPRETLTGRYIFDCFPETPEREAVVREALEAGLRGEQAVLERIPFRIQNSDGSWRDGLWEAHHMPVHDASGEIVGVTQKTMDVSAQVALERMRDTIVRELNHRVKNMFAKVIAVARRTGGDYDSIDDFVERFAERLHGMARAHDVLVDGPGDRVTIGGLVEAELAAFIELDDPRISCAGPEIWLDPRVGQALGMALHELATNAAKYGAIGQPDAALRVTWRHGDDGGARIDWRESGVAIAGRPARRGFGSMMIDRIAPSEMHARVERAFAPDGLRCSFDLAAKALAAA